MTKQAREDMGTCLLVILLFFLSQHSNKNSFSLVSMARSYPGISHQELEFCSFGKTRSISFVFPEHLFKRFKVGKVRMKCILTKRKISRLEVE